MFSKSFLSNCVVNPVSRVSVFLLSLFLSLVILRSEAYSQCSSPLPAAPSGLVLATTSTVAPTPTNTPTGIESGLVGYWKFDERTGSTACDSSGKGNNGALVNGPLWAIGKIGSALYFDGVDDNVTIADSNSLDVSSSFTLSAWVNPASSFTDFRSILVKNYKYYLYASVSGYCGSGSPLAGFDEQTSNNICQLSPLPANTWTHLAATYTGSMLTLYRNGVAIATSNITKTLSPSTGTLQIGASQFSENFKGLIDEVRIHNRGLMNSEIQALFQQESAVRESGLIAHLKFDEGSGTTASDSSGSANAGTLTNGPLWADARIGKGLYFDGIDDHVAVADSNSLDLSSSFTLSAWVNPASSFTDFRSILVKNYKYYLYASVAGFCGSGSPLAGFDEQTSNTLCQPSPLPANTWTHLAATYTGSILTLYRNGVAVATSNIAKSLSPTNGTLQIGASQFGENFKGLIDEVRVHNRALTNSEIQAIFLQEGGGTFSFSLANSGNKSVVAGSSVMNSITAALESGTSQSLSFSTSGLPSGATGTFSSATCTPACSTVLTIDTTGSTPAGSFPITVTSIGGGVTSTTAFTLSVTLALSGAVSSTSPGTIAPPPTANAYYVATNGNDSNPGTVLNPFRTIKKGLSALRAGYTLYLRAGIYSESIDTLTNPITGGTSFSNGPVIAGYPGERPILTGNGSDGFIVRLGQYGDTLSPYLTFRNLIIDGAAVTANSDARVTISADHQRFDNVEFRNTPAIAGQSILMFISDSADGTEFLNCSIHGAQRVMNPPPGVFGVAGYGVYHTGTNAIWDNCDIYNNGGYALHIYNSGSSSVSGNIVRNSRIWGNNTGNFNPAQVVISSGRNNQVYNTIIHSPAAPAGGVQVDYGCTDCKLYNNTIYGHSGAGIAVSNSTINTTVKDNRLYQNNPNIIDYGVGTFMSNNLTTAPLAP